jgi:PKD repeat protein
MAYKWNFGDGNITTVANPIITHAYSETGDYYVTLTVTDSDGLQDSVTKLVSVSSPGVYVSPTYGPVGTKVMVEGYGFWENQTGELYFDDHLLTYYVFTDATGRFNATFNVPLSEPGSHEIRVFFWPPPDYELKVNSTTFIVIDTAPLEVNVDVGTIHFRGETAEFYIQTIYKGTPVDATTIDATLFKPDGSHETLSPSKVSTGLYKATYAIPADAQTGSYVLTVEATYSQPTIDSKGASLKSFLVSDTLTGWNAWLVSIKDDMGTIKTDIGMIKANLTDVNATLVSIDGRIATIETDIGTIKTDIETINAKIASIEGNWVTITSDLGTIKQEMVPAGFEFGVATLTFSLVAALGAILSVVLLRKTRKAG